MAKKGLSFPFLPWLYTPLLLAVITLQEEDEDDKFEDKGFEDDWDEEEPEFDEEHQEGDGEGAGP